MVTRLQSPATRELFGLAWVDMSFAAWADHFARVLESGSGGRVLTPNPEMLMLAQDDDALMRILKESDYCLPDGVGLVFASRFLGLPLAARLAGSDTLEAVLPRFQGKIFLWGAHEDIVARAAERLAQDFPAIQVAGFASGYFEVSQEPYIIDSIIASGASWVLVAMGSPKQEYLIEKLYARHPGAWYMGVGGMFDVLAGAVPRAPLRVRRWGLEWLYRAFRQPGRIRRWPSLFRFLMMVLRQRVSGGQIKSNRGSHG